MRGSDASKMAELEAIPNGARVVAASSRTYNHIWVFADSIEAHYECEKVDTSNYEVLMPRIISGGMKRKRRLLMICWLPGHFIILEHEVAHQAARAL